MRNLGLGIALAVLLLLVGAQGAQAAPAEEDPGTVLTPAIEPEGLLAGLHDFETSSTGSTAGFATDPRAVPGYNVDDESVPTTPGATGWWVFFAASGSTFTIDSCGSAFTAQMTVYELEPSTDTLRLRDSTADACADPLSAEYVYETAAGVVPHVVRIDDATGSGGTYDIDYSRTVADPVAYIRKVKVGNVKRKRAKNGKKVSSAKVSVKIFFQGEQPFKIHCTLDGRERANCLKRPTFENVKSGKHEVKMTVTDSIGKVVTDTAKFRVPRK